LCAPSLGGESFGMVLIESFAAGTPVVASDIAGYRSVVRHGQDGLLVPRGQPLELAETLRSLWLNPVRRREMGAAARERSGEFAWPRIAERVANVYRSAIESPAPSRNAERVAMRVGLVPADRSDRRPPRRLASLEPAPPKRTLQARLGSVVRRGALGASALLGAVLALIALNRVGVEDALATLVRSSPSWVLVALVLFSASMLLRAVSWYAIVRAALPGRRVKRRVILSGTFIGVLMSATLPARLGEPSRALIVARRLGRPREYLPVVLGTLVSQTLLNVLALVILGAVMFTTIGLFAGHQQALLWYAVAPFGVLCAVLVAPALLRKGLPSRSARVGRWVAQARGSLARVRTGLNVYRRPRLGLAAASAQLGAWGIQWISCYVLLVALDLDFQTDLGTAAAVLFAVNVTAVLPLMPSNLGVFQAACVAVLSYAYGVPAAQALGYGIILQAVEIATAVVMGTPALVKEGLSWREVRLRALHTSPVSLSAPPGTSRNGRSAREAEA
jgi:phosphatidyl-myo-inositol alpha-mannosyltransferase